MIEALIQSFKRDGSAVLVVGVSAIWFSLPFCGAFDGRPWLVAVWLFTLFVAAVGLTGVVRRRG